MAEIKSFEGKIAITGATGLLGGYLVADLLENHDNPIVILLRRESSPQKLYSFLEYRGVKAADMARLEIVQFNMSNPFEWSSRLQNIDTVFHCAAVVAIGGIEASEIIYANTELTSKLVDGCLASGVKLLVHVSSIATLGGARHRGRMVNENMRLDNFSSCSAYTISKFFAENQVLRARALGLNTIIVHPAIILGSSNVESAGSSSIAAQAIKKGIFYTQGVMGYVDVCDISRAMIMLAQSPKALSKNYLLCADNISYKTIISSIRKAANKFAPLAGVGYKTLLFVSQVESLYCKIAGRKAVITKDIARNMSSKHYYDGSKISREFGFEYTPISQTLEHITKEYLSKK